MPVGSLFLFSIMKAVLRGGPVTTGLKSSQWLLEEPHSDDYSPAHLQVCGNSSSDECTFAQIAFH